MPGVVRTRSLATSATHPTMDDSLTEVGNSPPKAFFFVLAAQSREPPSPEGKTRGKLEWIWWVSGSMLPQGTTGDL
eukprot:1156915-Pelagomonas_calceolata.AAC.1